MLWFIQKSVTLNACSSYDKIKQIFLIVNYILPLRRRSVLDKLFVLRRTKHIKETEYNKLLNLLLEK